MAEEKPTLHLVYRFRSQTKDGKVYNRFHLADANGKALRADDDSPEGLALFERDSKAMRGSALRNPMVGGVYEVAHEPGDEGSIFPGSARYVRRIADREAITTWQAQDQVARDEIAAAKAEAKEDRRDYVLESLEPVRRAYQSMTSAQRAIFLARVVKRITNT
jgi:hypothetical protein